MTETQESKMCPICRRPKRSVSAGSLTQWISTCRCGLKDSSATDDAVSICADCRKRVGTPKGGSITQWIFTENICKCANPRLATSGADGADLRASDESLSARKVLDEGSGTSSSEEIYLDVDPATFPVDRYKPLKFIGKGALGEVYLCRDDLLKKKVAVKCLLNLTDDSIVSFQKEAKIVSKLKHDDVIRVLDFGTTSGGRPFMVMDYFPGQSLQEFLAEHGPLEEGELIEVFMQVCTSLQYLHDNNVFHRDLKPSNILLHTADSGDVRIRLIDFGLSKTTQEKQSKTLVDGHTIVGTPAYMSPDQVHGQPFDVRSEVYSLGCVMFEALTGKQPFEGKTALEVLNNHIHRPVPSVHTIEPAVSIELCELIEKCLSKSKEDRFSSMNTVAEQLSACMRVFENADESPGFDSSIQFEKTGLSEKNSSGISKPLLVISAVLVGGLSIFLVWRTFMTEDKTYKIGHHLNERVVFEPLGPAEVREAKVIKPGKIDKEKSGYTFDGAQDSLDVMDSFGATNNAGRLAADHSGSATKTLTSMIESGERIVDVVLASSKIVPGDLKLIARLNPQKLTLQDCTGITDRTIKDLSQIRDLRIINLNGCKGISPKGIGQLSALPMLGALWAENCDLTDEHLKEMKKIKPLLFVHLGHNKALTLNGVKYLGDKPITVSVNVDQPTIYKLSIEKQLQLKKEHNIVLVHPRDPVDDKDNSTAKYGLDNFVDVDQQSDLLERNLQ